jgi:hypothetical protein
MKSNLLSVLLLLTAVNSARAESDLTTQLDDLRIPQNVAPTGVTTEKLYAVQNRFVSLKSALRWHLELLKTSLVTAFCK